MSAARALLAAVLVAAGCTTVAPAPSPAPAVGRVMPLGDSITAGAGESTRSGYRIRLQQRLRAAGANVDMVGGQADGWCCDRDHEGHGGWTTAQVHAGLGPWLARQRPDVVLLHLGTNDVKKRIPAAESLRNLERIIRLIRMRRPDALVLLAPLIRTGDPAGQVRTQALNARLPGVITRAGGRTVLVRGMDSVGARAGEMTDVRHPNRRGYDRMAGYWDAALQARARGASWWPTTGR